MPEKHNAERWERYAEAVEQLGNANAPVRMDGVYRLIGLADEWLLDENLDYAEKVREGQVIINNLCACIRSSFALAFHYDELTQESPIAEGLYKNREQEFYIHKAELQAEADVRLSIIKVATAYKAQTKTHREHGLILNTTSQVAPSSTP